jgi:hypothetical protein
VRVIFACLVFLTISTYACAQVVSGAAVTESSNTRFKSPWARNVDIGTSASPSAPAQGRCKELSTGISQAIASPERKNVVVQRYGPDGKQHNELQEYDKRATLEAEYQQLGCQ